MKTAARRPFFARVVTILALPFAAAACGHTDTSSTQSTSGGDGMQYVQNGYAAFGSQCLSGFNTDPKPVKLELWSCPVTPAVQLTQPLQPLYLSADCQHKTLTIRSQDKSIDQTWELMPDGSFNITQDGLEVQLTGDATGTANCYTPISMDLWGQVDCSGNTPRDQAKVRFETVMWLNKVPQGASAPRSQPQCTLPAAKCYFHAISSVNQCN